MDIIVFNEIRKVLQSKEYIDKCMYEDKILIPFLEEMGYTGNHVEWKIEKDNVYDYIYDDIILFRYYSVLSIDQALMDLSKELEFGRRPCEPFMLTCAIRILIVRNVNVRNGGVTK